MVGGPLLVINLIEGILKKEVSEPSLMIDLEELTGKEVRDLTEREITDSEATKIIARRFITIVENMEAFIFTFKLGFNRCIRKAKEFFPNIDLNFLILIDLNAQSLMEEVVGGDLTFVEATTTVLDMGLEIANSGLTIEDDPPLEALGSEKDKGSSSLFPKPLKAPRSKKKRK